MLCVGSSSRVNPPAEHKEQYHNKDVLEVCYLSNCLFPYKSYKLVNLNCGQIFVMPNEWARGPFDMNDRMNGPKASLT